MKFYARFFGSWATIIARFDSLAECLIVIFSILLVTTGDQAASLVVTYLRRSLTLTRINVVVFRWKLGEMTLESLVTRLILIHGY